MIWGSEGWYEGQYEIYHVLFYLSLIKKYVKFKINYLSNRLRYLISTGPKMKLKASRRNLFHLFLCTSFVTLRNAYVTLHNVWREFQTFFIFLWSFEWLLMILQVFCPRKFKDFCIVTIHCTKIGFTQIATNCPSHTIGKLFFCIKCIFNCFFPLIILALLVQPIKSFKWIWDFGPQKINQWNHDITFWPSGQLISPHF